jgi:hypothetical protein
MSVKLDHSHRLTVQKVFGHPLNHNIKWVDVHTLLSRFGDVHESHSGNWVLAMGPETLSFGPVRERDLTEDQVMRVRHFLMAQGLSVDTVSS